MNPRPSETLEHPLQRFFKSQRARSTFEWERHQHRDVLLIDHPQCQAVFSRQGAQLLHFQPAGQKPWLWCSSQWPQVGAIRGGVPVCWPWYGRHPSEAGVSLHWRLQLCDWQADLYAELGSGMELRLSTHHEDSETCQFGHALHAYWRISDVEDVALQGLEGIQGYDQLNRRVCRQEGELRVAGGCQRMFEHSGPLQLQDQAWQRRLGISSGDSVNTRVWHPGNRPLLGVAGGEASGFVCVEAASGNEESLRLAPGERVELSLQARLLH